MSALGRRYWALRAEAAQELGSRSPVDFDDLPEPIRAVTVLALEKLRDEFRKELLDEIEREGLALEAAEKRADDFVARHRRGT